MPTQQTETSTELGPNRNTCELTASAPALGAKCHMHPNSKGIISAGCQVPSAEYTVD